jgi:tetratricopeptide (TPR) repeat protein
MDQHDVYAMLIRGRDLLTRGHHHQAATVLERATRLEPEKTSIREDLARALYLSGQKARAGEEFERVVELDPSNDYAHFGLGLCQAAAGNRKRALGHLKIAVAMRPDSEDYRHALQRLAG